MVMMQLRQAELTWQVIGDEVVILDLEGSVYLKLNGTGRVLWVHRSCWRPCKYPNANKRLRRV